jgi:hypothetical protein
VPKFALLIYSDESQAATASQEQQAQVMQEYIEYTAAITQEGINKAGEALHPTPAAKSVQVRGGERLVSDGPFAETKEQLGGFYIVEVDTEEQAIDAAARLPGSKWGTVEVRPVMEFPEA